MTLPPPICIPKQRIRPHVPLILFLLKCEQAKPCVSLLQVTPDARSLHLHVSCRSQKTLFHASPPAPSSVFCGVL